MDVTKIAFYSGANYMKRSSTTGHTTVTLPAYGSTVTATEAHVLGYVPDFDVFVDIDGDGILWAGEKIDQYTESSLTGIVDPSSPTIEYWSTANVLTVNINNTTTPTATGTRDVYWVIYLDYGNV